MVNLIPQIKAIHGWRKGHIRALDLIKFITIHRQEAKPTALEMAQWFRDEGHKWTGSKRMSYHFWITKKGNVQQCVPLHIYTPASGKTNEQSIQVALHGDFRTESPTPEQWEALVDLCLRLQRAFPRAEIVPHSPKKPCPGKNLSIAALKNEVWDRLETRARRALKCQGFKL